LTEAPAAPIRILAVGDVFGSPGRSIVRAELPRLREELALDLVIINAENAAGGFGITRRTCAELFAAGADVLTTGTHVWDRKEAASVLEHNERVLRPTNYPPATPGRGWCLAEISSGAPVAVVNVHGRVLVPTPFDCPFRAVDSLLEGPLAQVRAVVVDFHAEATSEKRALGWYLDGRVSAVLGTHTHVTTADEEILPGGTAFQTDLGMTGPHRSVIGARRRQALNRFLDGRPHRLQVAAGDVRLHGALIEVEPSSGRALSIDRVRVDRSAGGGVDPAVRKKDPKGC
jgi:2',3'-cyclic-nucleotide 2'-phosphodiesterase